MVFIIFKSSWVQFFVTSHMYVRITFWKLQVIMVIIIAVKFRMGIYILILLIVTIRRPRPTATGSAPGNKSCSVSTTNTWNTRERAEGHEFDFGTGGHLRPLAATCGHLLWRPLLAASGCKWLPMKRECGRPLAATRVAASGCKWLPMKNQMLVATGGHLRPLDWRWRTLAAAGGHSIGCKWLQVAADEKKMLVATGGHSLAARGCKWLPMRREWWRPLAATGDHSSGCKWLQVAARRGWNYMFHHSSSLGRRILGILGIFRFLRTAHGKFITFSVGGVLAMWSTVLSSFLCWGSFFGVRHGQYETF